jgi:prepilin-type N-terminal cleavage/methylation domain-containing protein
MSKKKSLSGFTLVELMVSMAIIAVLMGLSVFGIATAQQILRDDQRRDALKSIAAGITSYYAANQAYPPVAGVTFATAQVTLATGFVVPLTGPASAAATTNASQTAYCYSIATDGYRLGAYLEAGSWFNLGTSLSTKCTAYTGDVKFP